MAGDIFLSASVLWIVLAIATAREASYLGNSFFEFFVYALVALPVVVVVVALASEAEHDVSRQAAPDTDARTRSDATTGRDTGMSPGKIGAFTLRAGVAASIVAAFAFFAGSPERIVTAVERTVITMEDVAYQGVRFDECVSEEGFVDCQPLDDLAVSAVADLDVALERGVGLSLADVRPAVTALLDGMSDSRKQAAERSSLSARTASATQDVVGGADVSEMEAGDGGTVRSEDSVRTEPVTAAISKERGGSSKGPLVLTSTKTAGSPLRLVRD